MKTSLWMVSMAAGIGLAVSGSGQSGTAWIQVKDTDVPATALPADLTTGYLTVAYHGIVVSKNDDWWTKIVQGTARAAVAVKATNGANTVGLALTGLEFRSGDQIEYGTRKTLFSKVPSSESGQIVVETEAKKFAEDGIKEAVDAINGKLGGVVEAATLAQASLVYNGARVVLDGLFKLDLNQTRMNSSQELNITTAAGTYVVFASDSMNDYNKFRNEPENLSFKGGLLKFKNQPISNISFAVYSVSLTARKYPKALDALTAIETAWQPKYAKAEDTAGAAEIAYPVGNASDVEKKLILQALDSQTKALYVLIDSAEDLVDADITLTGVERRRIKQELFSFVHALYELRLEQLAGGIKIDNLPDADKMKAIAAVRKRLVRYNDPIDKQIKELLQTDASLRSRMMGRLRQ